MILTVLCLFSCAKTRNNENISADKSEAKRSRLVSKPVETEPTNGKGMVRTVSKTVYVVPDDMDDVDELRDALEEAQERILELEDNINNAQLSIDDVRDKIRTAQMNIEDARMLRDKTMLDDAEIDLMDAGNELDDAEMELW